MIFYDFCEIYKKIFLKDALRELILYDLSKEQAGKKKDQKIKQNTGPWRLPQKLYDNKSLLVNPFYATVLFLYPPKISENLWFYDILRGTSIKRPVIWNRLKMCR